MFRLVFGKPPRHFTISVGRPVTQPPRRGLVPSTSTRLSVALVEVSRRAELPSALLRGPASGVDSLRSPFSGPDYIGSSPLRSGSLTLAFVIARSNPAFAIPCIEVYAPHPAARPPGHDCIVIVFAHYLDKLGTPPCAPAPCVHFSRFVLRVSTGQSGTQEGY
jgi:hypothetical protein